MTGHKSPLIGNSKEGAKDLAEGLSHASKPLLSNAKPDTHAVASLIENEKLYVGKGTTTIVTPEGISFQINQPRHLATVDGFSQKSGISGAHNADAFNAAIKQYNVKIVSETPTGVNGMTNIRYQVPAFDRAGNVIGYKSEVKTKTVYDPKVFTDQKILDLGQQAATKGYKDAMSSSKGIADATVNGVTFRIYVDKITGEVRNFHPK
ncbi:CdiA family toxin C-terminal domain-containing protein [Photorhabdus sp. UCH-936]|nr:CdiA family toxin C-terminal domain-containing protein [Photorhabdus antumapuensis]